MIYTYQDGDVEATFDRPGLISPEDATAELQTMLEASGGYLIDGFRPTEQDRKSDEGYVSADLRIMLPSGARVWLNVECATDQLA